MTVQKGLEIYTRNMNTDSMYIRRVRKTEDCHVTFVAREYTIESTETAESNEQLKS